MSKDDYRRDIEDLIAAQSGKNRLSLCPFDKLPCEFVDSCDDVLSLQTGFDMIEEGHCPRSKGAKT
jgi:hypothetical protein